MRLRLCFLAVIAAPAMYATAASAQYPHAGHPSRALRALMREYQGRDRGPEQTDRFSAKYKVGRDGRVTISNISGDIVVTGGSGDEVAVDATKRTRGDRGRLAEVRIEASTGPGRVDIRTEYPRISARSARLGCPASGYCADAAVAYIASAAITARKQSRSRMVVNPFVSSSSRCVPHPPGCPFAFR